MSLITTSMENLSRAMKMHAKKGFFDGATGTAYFDAARRFHQETGSSLLFTRDIGYHSSGWFKNPDYERCWHLSMSFWDAEKQNPLPRPYEPKLAEAWVHCFFGPMIRYIWEEGMTSETRPVVGNEVRHYRVFCNPAWQPIIPRGEVYTKDFTEKGWLSWSDKQYAQKQIGEK